MQQNLHFLADLGNLAHLLLVIQIGHHHEHPLTGALELRPDHWSATLRISPRDPKDLRTDTDQTFLINQTDSACIHTISIYLYISYNFSLFTSFVFSTKPCQLVILEPRIWSSVSYHYHATLIPTLSYLMLNSYQTHHFNFMNHLIQSSCSHHVKTHKSQLIHHLIHKGHPVHKLKRILIQACCPLFKIKENINPTTFSPNILLRQKGLAQARRTLAQASSLRLGESSTSRIKTLRAFSLRRDPPRLSETFARPKSAMGRLGDPSWRNT